MKLLPNASLKPFHTFAIDVKAEAIGEAESVEEMLALWRAETFSDKPKLILGEGSNLLFCEDFAGLVILNRVKGKTVTEDNNYWYLHIAGGENWHQLVSWSIENGMPGLENLALIPGCVGTSPIQNIGAYGVELKDSCQYVDVLNLDSGQTYRMTAEECQFGYRDSVFKHELKEGHVIVAVGFKLSKNWQPNVSYGPLAELAQKQDSVTPNAVFDAVCAIRRSKLPDPSVLGNAGSFFKNPVVKKAVAEAMLAKHPNVPVFHVDEEHSKLAAGWLIEQCNLKGKTIGGAKVHEKQALVIVNTGDATSDDIIQLARYAVNAVHTKFGIELEHEVRFMAATQETTLEAL